MCVAIVRVKYRTEKSADLIEIATEEQLAEKLESLRTQSGILKVEVFERGSKSFERVEVWRHNDGSLTEIDPREMR
jgi:hypothetical protein